MPTNLAIDEKLISEAQSIGKHPSKRAAVTAALREYVNRRRLEILDFLGTEGVPTRSRVKLGRHRQRPVAVSEP